MASVLCQGELKNLVGTTDGYVRELALGSFQDLSEPVRAYVVTGYLNQGSNLRKFCRAVRLGLRRGIRSSTTGPAARLKWRDRPGPWAGDIPVNLGAAGDTQVVLTYHSLGVYRTRQWCFEWSGGEDLALTMAEEEFDVLED
jgi:hypothetical protein